MPSSCSIRQVCVCVCVGGCVCERESVCVCVFSHIPSHPLTPQYHKPSHLFSHPPTHTPTPTHTHPHIHTSISLPLLQTGTCTVLSLYHLDLDATQRFGEKDVFHVLHPYVKLVEGLTPATATSFSTSPSSSSSSSTTTTSKKGEQKENGQDHTHTHTHTPQETECWSYRTIQILDPASLLVNGRPVDVRHVTPAKVVLDNFDL